MEHQDGTALLNSVDPTPSNQAATGRAIPQEWFMTRPPVGDVAMKRRRRVRIAQRTAAAAVGCAAARVVVA